MIGSCSDWRRVIVGESDGTPLDRARIRPGRIPIFGIFYPAGAACHSAEKLHDRRLGQIFDYAHRSGINQRRRDRAADRSDPTRYQLGARSRDRVECRAAV